MHAQTPITLAVAGYGGRDGALRDHDTVWSAREDGDFHHRALAVVTRQPDGGFGIEGTDNTARYLTWGDGLLAGAVFVLLPGGRFQLLPTWDTGGRRAIARHFNRHVDQDDLAAAAGLLEESRFGLIVVVVNRAAGEIRAQLLHARRSVATDMVWGDLEEELGRDLVESSSTRPDPARGSSAELFSLLPASHAGGPPRAWGRLTPLARAPARIPFSGRGGGSADRCRVAVTGTALRLTIARGRR